nr:reverse transcriptase domain-containing protein [Tanacetum cinerariifolium]
MSSAISVPASAHLLTTLSSVQADCLPPRKRFRSSLTVSLHKEIVEDTVDVVFNITIELVTSPVHDEQIIDERLEEHEEVIQGIYKHLLEIPIMRFEELKEEQRALMTPKAIEQLIGQRVAKALASREANQNNVNRDGNRNRNETGNRNETIGIDEAYEMLWKDLMKLMIEIYSPRNEIQKLKNKLWNLSVKGTDVVGERELHHLQQMQDKANESCMESFRQLHSLLQVLSNNDLKRHGSEGGFEWAFASLSDQDVQTFRDSMLLNLDQLQKQLDKDEFQEDSSIAAFWMQTHASKVDSSKALDDDLVVMENNGTESGKKDTSSSSGNYLTHVVDADIRLVNDQMPFAEVQLTAQYNVLANEQQHTEQFELIYDTYLLEKINSNNTPDSTIMSHRRGEIDQDAEQYQVKNLLLNAELFKMKNG